MIKRDYTQITDDINNISSNDLWKNYLNNAKQYIDIYNKRPSSCDNSNEVKHLGKWVSTQKNNYKYKTNRMTDQEFYNLWTDFINDDKYKNYV